MSATFNGTFDIPGFREAWRRILGSALKYGVLEVASDTSIGILHVYCGRYITGAQMPGGIFGVAAFQQLFETPSGRFAYREAQHAGEGSSSQQSFMIDIYEVLDLLDELAADGCLHPSPRLSSGLERLARSAPWEPPAEFDGTPRPSATPIQPEVAIAQVAVGKQPTTQNGVGETISKLLDALFSSTDPAIEPAPEMFERLQIEDTSSAIAV